MLDSPPSSPSLFAALCGCWRERSLSFLDFIFGANGEREKGKGCSEVKPPVGYKNLILKGGGWLHSRTIP